MYFMECFCVQISVNIFFRHILISRMQLHLYKIVMLFLLLNTNLKMVILCTHFDCCFYRNDVQLKYI